MGSSMELYPRPRLGRTLLIFAVLPALVCLLGAGYVIVTVSQDPATTAEARCPAAPNGVDSIERQECINREINRTPADIARRWLLAALVLAVTGGIVAYFTSRGGAGRGTVRD